MSENINSQLMNVHLLVFFYSRYYKICREKMRKKIRDKEIGEREI